MKDSCGNEWVVIPIAVVSSRAYIEWQCGGASGMTLNRLAETCGCFSHKQESFSCHHPDGQDTCSHKSCPVAYVDYPEGATEEECNRYDEGYGDEIRMGLSSDGKFGNSGVVRVHWWREVRSADELVLASLRVPEAA